MTHQLGDISVVFTQQSPTNAIFDSTGATFYCASSLVDCRVNLTFAPTFTGNISPRAYQFQYSTGDTFLVDDDANPATLYFPR